MRYLLPLMAAVAVFAGCDLLDPAKVGDPVFGPPPPRKVVKAAPTDPNAKASDTAVVAPDGSPATPNAASGSNAGPSSSAGPGSGTAPSLDSGPGSDTGNGAVTTARGSSPDKTAAQTASTSDGEIKRAGYTSPIATDGKMSGNEIVASINGQPLFASEIFERAATEPLTSQGLSLLIAGKLLETKQITEQEYRELQMAAIRKFGKDYVRTRVLSQAMIAALEKDQQKKIEDAVTKEFDNYMESKLKKDFKVMTAHEVDQVLHSQGTSLASIREEFRNRLLADEYLRGKSKKEHLVGREEILAYYQEHDADFSFPEKVHWQVLQISFEKHGGRDAALKLLSQAVDALRRGESFGKVAKKYSDGLHAEDGGTQPWTRAESIVDEKIAQTLRSLAAGETSPVLSSRDAYRLVRVIERKPAGKRPLGEVQEVIKQILEDKIQKEAMRHVLVEAYQKASIESAYLPPEDLLPPADFAGIPAAEKNSDAPAKKGRKRS
jgi:parvulin-like peptidyl-prolyl isomerase